MSHHIEKWARTLALVGILVFTGVIVSQLQVAFGWTNPLQNPPGGSGAVGVSNGQVFIGPQGTAPSSTAILTLNGALSVMNNLISDVNTPIGAKDAVNKAYVDAQTGGGGSGAGSMVLYYKTNNSINTITPPTCPSGWTQQMSGYGPHYIGVISYDWLYQGTGGTGGGFGGTGGGGSPPPPPTGGDPSQDGAPPAPGAGSGVPAPSGYSFTTGDIAFGSDSVCSQDRFSIVKLNQLYLNATTTNQTTWYADACSTDVRTPGITECNMCIVCIK